jgi:hypothetical protein
MAFVAYGFAWKRDHFIVKQTFRDNPRVTAGGQCVRKHQPTKGKNINRKGRNVNVRPKNEQKS